MPSAVMLWDNAFVLCKDCHLYWFSKTLIGQFQAGNIDGTTKLREFWEEERESVTSQMQKRQDKNASMRKGTKPLLLNIDKNYGLHFKS